MKIKKGDLIVRNEATKTLRFSATVKSCDGDLVQANKMMDWDPGWNLSVNTPYEVMWVYPNNSHVVLKNFLMVVPIEHVEFHHRPKKSKEKKS